MQTRSVSLSRTFSAASTAASTSTKVDAPVEIIIGFPLDATYEIKSTSPVSNEAILYIEQLSPSRKSTAVRSNGVLKGVMFKDLANSNSSLCHSHGVWASS